MRRRLPRSVLARCFLRSLLLQSAWNVQGMQNLGFSYAIWPVLAALYPDPEARKAAVARHLEPFNTHPYMAEAILGGAIHHELRIAAGHADPAQVGAFKRALAGPLAGLGDTFFWASWRPAMGALGVLLLPILGGWAIPVFLLLYNAVHLSVRLYLFRSGVGLGDAVLGALGPLRLAERAAMVKALAAAAAGLALVAWVGTQAHALGYSVSLVTVGVAAGAGVLVVLLRAGVNPYLVAGVAAGAGVLAGIAA
jgi:PTS system mannose-specific IID component